MTYQLRRLRLHGLIERIPKTHRYRLTDFGFRVALFCTRAYSRIPRLGLGLVLPATSSLPCPLRRSFDRLEQEVNIWVIKRNWQRKLDANISSFLRQGVLSRAPS